MAKGIIAVVVILVLAAGGYMIYTKGQKQESVKISANVDHNFGEATILQIDIGKNILACEDAKILANMISNINKDFAENPELSSSIEPDNMTPAMKDFEATMDVFGKKLEEKYSADQAKMEEVLQGIGEGVSNVFQVSIMAHLKMIAEDKLPEYIDVTYCGVPAKEGYISPLEMEIEDPHAAIDNDSATPAPETPVK